MSVKHSRNGRWAEHSFAFLLDCQLIGRRQFVKVRPFALTSCLLSITLPGAGSKRGIRSVELASAGMVTNGRHVCQSICGACDKGYSGGMVCRSRAEVHDASPPGMADRREAMPYVVGQDNVRNFQRKVKGRWLLELYEFYLPLEVPGL